MRGWKMISWKQFSGFCGARGDGPFENKLFFCGRKAENRQFCSTDCSVWRKLRRAELSVEKITVRPQRAMQQTKHVILCKNQKYCEFKRWSAGRNICKDNGTCSWQA